MPLPDLYSRRKRRALGESREVYIYDDFDKKIRIQILYILRDALGKCTSSDGFNTRSTSLYNYLSNTIRKEIGVFNLTNKNNYDAQQELEEWFLTEKNPDYILDYIELAFFIINTHIRENKTIFSKSDKELDDCILQLNERLEESGIGYRFVEDVIIRHDSEFVHSEIVIPALNLTYNNEFTNVNKEYIKAHEQYRNKDYESCLIECAKAFESTLKIIGFNLNWNTTNDCNASKLVNAAVSSGFLDKYLENGFSSLRAMLESGIPSPRNKAAGHGAGTQSRTISAELAAYQLHQTAAAIVFLITRYQQNSTAR